MFDIQAVGQRAVIFKRDRCGIPLYTYTKAGVTVRSTFLPRCCGRPSRCSCRPPSPANRSCVRLQPAPTRLSGENNVFTYSKTPMSPREKLYFRVITIILLPDNNNNTNTSIAPISLTIKLRGAKKNHLS